MKEGGGGLLTIQDPVQPVNARTMTFTTPVKENSAGIEALTVSLGPADKIPERTILGLDGELTTTV
mgnify:CR=1 FL=1